MYTTYSFTDVTFSIHHPGVGRFSANGEGLGSINISMTNDRSAHDIAADGTVMVSKIKSRNGTITITAQQTSSLHKWLTKWSNYLDGSDTSAWAETTIIIRAPKMGDLITVQGVSPQKMPDKPYQAQGQNISWAMMAADIQHDVI